MLGSRIGPYKLVREISADALGQVFEASDVASRKPVMIRALTREIATRPETVSRLYSEAKTLALLNHPHIGRIFGFIRHNDQLFLVMEFVEGESLQSILQAKRRLAPAIALAYFHQILSAVAFAHKLGVIHGDLKPSNIIVTGFGQIKVLDFAIAPILGGPDPESLRGGTSRYMSPEQVRREPLDARSDIYSLGALLYESIVGRASFDCDEESGAAVRPPQSTPLPLSLLVKNCPMWLDRFVLRALAPSPLARFQTVAAMSQAMDLAVESEIRAAAAQRRLWRRRQPVRRLQARSSALFASARRIPRRMRESAASGFGAAAATVREKRTATARMASNGLARMNPVPWTRRGAVKIKSGLYGAASALEQALAALFQRLAQGLAAGAQRLAAAARMASACLARMNPVPWMRRGPVRIKSGLYGAASALEQALAALFQRLAQGLAAAAENVWQSGRQITAATGRLASSGLAALRSKFTMKSRPAMPENRTRALRALPAAAGRLLGSARAKLGTLSETGWQRYAAMAIVLASAMIEIFVFGGANTLLMSDQSRLMVATQDGAAETLLDPPPAPAPIAREAIDTPPQPRSVKRASAERKVVDKPSDNTEAAHEARVAKRTVTYRAELERPRPLETRVSEPVAPRRNTENNVQLNVKWEN